MRHVFEHQDEARERGARAAADIRHSHSPEAAGRTMAKRLRWIIAQQDAKPAANRRANEPPVIKLETIVKHIEAGPQIAPGRFGSIGRFIRQTMLRLIWPVLMHQQFIDKEIVTSIKRTSDGLNERLQETARGLEAQSATAHAEMLAQLRNQNRQIDDLLGELATLRTKTAAVERLVKKTHAIPYMSGSPFELYKNPVWGPVLGYRRAESVGSNGAYGTLEDIFRESEPSIRDRQRYYLDLLADCAPVLDAACGRGEFLDLLREHGIEYVGIDPDPRMVEHCRTKGHEPVKLIDVNSYLEGCADGSLGAIFCTRLIEGLSHSELSRFLALSSQKLKPDGLLITESPNPHSAAAIETFQVDLTYQRPVYPEAALALCRTRGFASAFVFFPNGSGDIETDRLRESKYALVATKVEQE
jgi:SAM-dependent methyltransferase